MKPQKKILLIEDELSMAGVLSEILQKEGFLVKMVNDGKEGLKQFFDFQPDVCVIDIMLPGMDGYNIVSNIRASGAATPLILLTAKTQVDDVVKGFSMGANDYVRKPFSVQELMARINVQLAQVPALPEKGNIYALGKYTYDEIRQQLVIENKVTQLTGKENELLLFLCKHMNQTVLKRDILLNVWGHEDFYNSRNLDVYMSKLRKYFTADDDVAILNIRGYGYRFTVAV